MKIQLSHNAEQVGRFVQFVFAEQLPFVTAKAINVSAIAGQKAQRKRQRDVFDVRRPRWVDRAVKIKPFATKRSPEAKIAIDPPGHDRGSVLIRHEDEAQRTPFSARFLAVPTEHVRRTATGVIRRADRPQAIKERGRRGRGTTTRGAFGRGTYMELRGNRGVIWERVGQGNRRPLYWLVPSVPLDRRLEFVPTIKKAVEGTFSDAFTEAFDQAIRTAR